MTDDTQGGGTPSRGGRRRGSAATRDQILRAAIAQFAEKGYEGASLRSITAQAGVDVAMVSHFFGSKQGLFEEAVLDRGEEALKTVLEITQEQKSPSGLLDAYFSLWEDPSTAQTVRALFRVALESEEILNHLRDLMSKNLGSAISLIADSQASAPSDPQTSVLQTQLLAAHLMGIGMARYIMKLSPLAEVPRATLVAQLEPTIATYLPGGHRT